MTDAMHSAMQGFELLGWVQKWNIEPNAVLLIIVGHVMFHVLRVYFEGHTSVRLISGLSIVGCLWLGWPAVPILVFSLLLIYLLAPQAGWHWGKLGADLLGVGMVNLVIPWVNPFFPETQYTAESINNPWFYLTLLEATMLYFGVRMLVRRWFVVPHRDAGTLDITVPLIPLIMLTYQNSHFNTYLLLCVMVGLYLLLHLQYRIRSAEAALKTEKLRILQARVVTSALESERSRIAREIHDGPLQEIIAAKRMLEANQVQRSSKILADAVAHLRSAIYDMHPSVLQLGLERALQSLAQRAQPLEVHFDFPDELPSLSEEQQSAIYRVVGEAISNATKHARASNVQVKLQVEAHLLRITIEDDGVGFNRSQVTGGLGLISMRERTESLGGSCELHSSPKGTRIRITLPVAAPSLDLGI
ncbi:sensor histidine kinase [Deinococcus cellulosilyticus]|uniref:Oxygen sensor histidine kinase NreB n=1 Tax=Deinococcus cellulosilyticus (strain DSM 18568 / NBRC 106333 / KACC 11606 / 5516J-15) TaxID=1223518 RepID=A0A511NBQ0_DEIC1|nr:sensor histidine kinase [Deinococcus cellulosilyticus]GEM49996.1 hypothetical protein DC3_56310 [Deinococcus cellulosilyticus NBRC 106333 = KACC 11606]